MEIPPVVWVSPFAFPPDNGPPWRRLVDLDDHDKRLCCPSRCLYAGATWHPRRPLFSRQTIQDEIPIDCQTVVHDHVLLFLVKAVGTVGSTARSFVMEFERVRKNNKECYDMKRTPG